METKKRCFLVFTHYANKIFEWWTKKSDFYAFGGKFGQFWVLGAAQRSSVQHYQHKQVASPLMVATKPFANCTKQIILVFCLPIFGQISILVDRQTPSVQYCQHKKVFYGCPADKEWIHSGYTMCVVPLPWYYCLRSNFATSVFK